HQLAFGADLCAHDRGTAHVIVNISADLHLEDLPAAGDRLATEATQLVVVVAEPAGRGRVGGVADLADRCFAFSFARGLATQNGERLVGRQGVGDVAEGDAGDELLRRHVDEQLPERLAFGLRVEIPDGVDDGGRRQVDGAFVRADPAQL